MKKIFTIEFKGTESIFLFSIHITLFTIVLFKIISVITVFITKFRKYLNKIKKTNRKQINNKGIIYTEQFWMDKLKSNINLTKTPYSGL